MLFFKVFDIYKKFLVGEEMSWNFADFNTVQSKKDSSYYNLFLRTNNHTYFQILKPTNSYRPYLDLQPSVKLRICSKKKWMIESNNLHWRRGIE